MSSLVRVQYTCQSNGIPLYNNVVSFLLSVLYNFLGLATANQIKKCLDIWPPVLFLTLREEEEGERVLVQAVVWCGVVWCGVAVYLGVVRVDEGVHDLEAGHGDSNHHCRTLEGLGLAKQTHN